MGLMAWEGLCGFYVYSDVLRDDRRIIKENDLAMYNTPTACTRIMENHKSS